MGQAKQMFERCKVCILSSILVLLSTGLAYGVSDITGKFHGPKEGVKPLKNLQVYEMRAGAKRVLRTIPQAVTGTMRVAVIVVQFSSAGNNTSSGLDGSYQLTPADLSNISSNIDYAKAFYHEASYGKVALVSTYYSNGASSSTLTGNETPFTLNHAMSYYGMGDESGGSNGLETRNGRGDLAEVVRKRHALFHQLLDDPAILGLVFIAHDQVARSLAVHEGSQVVERVARVFAGQLAGHNSPGPQVQDAEVGIEAGHRPATGGDGLGQVGHLRQAQKRAAADVQEELVRVTVPGVLEEPLLQCGTVGGQGQTHQDGGGDPCGGRA